MTRRVLQELFITGADQAAELDGPGGKGDEPTSTIWVRVEARHLIPYEHPIFPIIMGPDLSRGTPE